MAQRTPVLDEERQPVTGGHMPDSAGEARQPITVAGPGRLSALAAVGVGLGAAFTLLIPWAQSLWPLAHGPAVAVDRVLLRWTYGEAVVRTSEEGFPILGKPGFLVRVTPQCSELEAILALWLLGG